MITRLRYPKGYQFFDGNGAPLALGQLFYFGAGTTAVQDTYSDSGGAAANTNPLILDGSGRLSADIYLGSGADYKEVLTNAAGALVAPWPDDNIPRAGQADWNATSGPSQILNKPTLAAVAISGSYGDLSNAPAAPSAFTGDSGSGGTAGLVPAPAAGTAVANKFLKADGTWAVPPGGSGSGATNLTATETSTSVAIASSTGSGLTLPAATPAAAGVMTAADRTTLNGLGTASTYNAPASGNASPSQAVIGSDTRLSDSRAPTAHASTHASGGPDAISIAAGQVSGIPASLASQNLDNVSRVGIGTTDTGNKLSVSAPSVLFSNSGDMRATVSKGASSNTAAFNFQDNFSTRVQCGLLGNDDFTVSMSADGSTFNNALVANHSTGAVTFPNTGGFTGDSGSGGAAGLVPAPAAGTAAAGKFLKADGTWSIPSGGSSSNMTGATSSANGAAGLAPAPAAGQQTYFLRGDGTWAQVAASNVSGLAASATTDATNAGNISSGTLPAGRLPAPTSATLGGVKSYAAVANQFLTSVDTSGNHVSAQPSAANISGLAASAITDTTNASNISSGTLPAGRLPNPSASSLGGVQSIAATAHQFLTSISMSGVPASAQPAASDISGLAASATTDTTNAANIGSGTLPSARLSGSYTGITGVGTLTAGSVPASLVSGLANSATTDATNAANIGSGTLPAARLPNPSASSLGGVQSLAAVSHKWINAISTSGVPSATQPASTDLSDGTAAGVSMFTAASAAAQTALLSNMVGDTGSGGTAGLVPAPASGTAAAGKFLKADGTWSVPSGGSSSNMTGATSGAAGAAGLVPAPSAGQQNLFLRGDATFNDPGSVLAHFSFRDTTISGFTGAKYEMVQVAGQVSTTDTSTSIFSLSIASGEVQFLTIEYIMALADFSKCRGGNLSRAYKNVSGTISALSTSGTYTSGYGQDTTASLSIGFSSSSGVPYIYLSSDSTSNTYNYFATIRILHMKTNS